MGLSTRTGPVELEELAEPEEGEVGGEDRVVDAVSSPPIWLRALSL